MNQTPFARAARAYFDSGWSPIPLPHEAKSPVPDSPSAFTGASGEYVSLQQLKRWLGERARAQAGNFHYPPSNIALRLPRDILGIDVDAHGSKKGAQTLARAEEAWGALPATWVSTSKRDGVSGIRLFRIPEGLAWPGELPQGKGVELIRWDHRYVIVAPSIHDKTSEEYRWCREVLQPAPGGGQPGEGEALVTLVDCYSEFPDVDSPDIPPLPQEWVEGLTSGEKWKERAAGAELSADEIQEWLLSRPEPEAPCQHMRSLISKGLLATQVAGDDGGVHDTARDAAWGVLNDAKAGHAGVAKALRTLKGAFLTNVEGRRDSERHAETEWTNIVQRGISKVDADKSAPYETEDPCTTIRSLGSAEDGSPPRMGSGDTYPNDDPGNAARLFRTVNGRARWVPGWEKWAIWKGDRWAPDNDGQMDRWAVKTVRDMEQEIAHMQNYADAKAIAAQRRHMKSSGSEGKLKAMQSVMRTRKGIIAQAEAFDAKPNLLAVKNGVLQLGKDGVRLLTADPDMLLTKNTGVPWQPARLGASPMWNEFLERFLPDLEVRDWLQRITGYSLLGHNNARHIVALVGETSCGKSTYAEVVRRVLGDYGAVMTSSVLRESNDDKARPDMLTVFGSRIAVSDEVGRAKKLHADQVKRLTGAVPIKARGMRSNDFVVSTASFTPWIVGNTVPEIEGHDDGLDRRLLPVPFDMRIDQSIEILDFLEELLCEGAPSILAWCVEGYEKWLLAPRLEELPVGAVALSQRIREESSDFGLFCAQKLDNDKEAFLVPSHAYQAYQMWCAEGGIQQGNVLPIRQFGMSMTSRYGATKSKKLDDGKVIKVYRGVRIL